MIVEVVVQQPVYSCTDCGVRTQFLDKLLERALHESYDDDCPVAWAPNPTVEFRQTGPIEVRLAPPAIDL